jgi:hypothetical protein
MTTAIIIIAIIGVAGFLVWKNNKTKADSLIQKAKDEAANIAKKL